MTMKNIKRYTGKILAILLGICMLFGIRFSSYAATCAEIDFGKTGSVTLTLKTADGQTVSGGTLTIYQVANLYLEDGDMAYNIRSDFAGCGVKLNIEDTTLPAMLAAYAAANGIEGTDAVIRSGGTACFDDLQLGLYLIVQTEASDQYKEVNPFLVTIPLESDGVWVYDVDASPKVGTVTPKETTEPETTTEPEVTTETEEATTEAEETTEPEATTEAEETTVPEETTILEKLPQTGQLYWPVPLLAACGVLLYAVGWILKRNTNNERTHEE